MLTALALFAASGCHSVPSEKPPHLILILVDNLRADHLGIYGYERRTSPQIDRLGARGVVFDNAMATSSWTKPSVGSLFTSRLPSEHNAVSFTRHLSPRLPTVAELLRQAGYLTVGVTGNFIHVNERWGFDRGFDRWNSISVKVDKEGELLWLYEPAPGTSVPLRAPHASEINREVLKRLPARAGDPLFLYVHYMEPHSPFTPQSRHLEDLVGAVASGRAPIATNDYLVRLARGAVEIDRAERQWLIDLYDAEIAGVDEALGELLDELAQRGFLDRAVIVVVSDHGEEFGDHGGWFHGLTLYRESLSIPLVIHDTRTAPAGPRRRGEPVDLIDVPTTLLALAGIPRPEGMRGRALLGERPLPKRNLVAELHKDSNFESHVRPRHHRFALTHWPWKAIVTRDESLLLYHLERDPAEASPLDAEAEPLPAALLDSIALVKTAFRDASGDAGEALDPSTLEGLRALGYAE